MPVCTPAATRKRLLECFEAWDVEKAGKINHEELVTLLVKVGVPKADVETVFNGTSLNRDGAVDYKEFVHWSIGAPPLPPVLPLLPVSIASAQQAWRDGFLEIGAAGREEVVDDIVDRIATFVDTMYAFGSGAVIFKPMAGHESTAQLAFAQYDAMKYFSSPLLQYVCDVRFENALTLVKGDFQFALGHYCIVLVTGQIKIADYTFGYERNNGGMPIFLHHSSALDDVCADGACAQSCIAVEDSDLMREVAAAQGVWCAGLLDLAAATRNGEDSVAKAGDFIDAHYAYHTGQVLFKSATGAGDARFMMTRNDAITYFSNPILAALTGVSFDNVRHVVKGDYVFVIGIYKFECAGTVATGEYVFGYEPCAAKRFKIFLHLSSTPFL